MSAACAGPQTAIATDSIETRPIRISMSLPSSLPGIAVRRTASLPLAYDPAIHPSSRNPDLMDARIKSGHDSRVPPPCSNDEAAATSQQPQPRPFVPNLLLRVADAIDRAGPVVGHQQRAVLGQDDVGGTAEIALVAFEPAGGEDFLLGVLAVGPDDHALDARALVLMPVPGAVFGDEDVVLVLGGELIAGVELHAERRHMRAEIEDGRGELRALVTHREFRIRQIALVAIGIAEMLADLRDHVELVTRDVVAHPVAGVFREPVFSAARIDVAADAVANPERVDFGVAGFRIDAADLRHRGRRNADVEGRSEWQVHHAVLVDRDVFPAMRGVGRHVVIHHLAAAEVV